MNFLKSTQQSTAKGFSTLLMGLVLVFFMATAPSTAFAQIIDRTEYYNELLADPVLVDNLCRLTNAEVNFGLNPECSQQFMETVMNRAYAKNTTLAWTISRESGYWPPGQERKALTNGENATCRTLLDRVLAGSNLSNYATDNASSQLALDREADGLRGQWCDSGNPSIGNEFFYTNAEHEDDMRRLSEESGGAPPLPVMPLPFAPPIPGDDLPPETPPATTPPPPPGGGSGGGGSGGGGNSGGGGGDGCGASCSTCQECAQRININHQRIRAHISSEFSQHRTWIVTSFFIDNILPAMALMTTELTATGMQQVQIIGTFFDAKHQLETQRLFQTLTAQAHKDYHPSEGLCEIGTNVRSLAASERRNDLSYQAISKRMMDRQNLNMDGISSGGGDQDRQSRLDLFINKFCDKTDHAGGLEKLCRDGGQNAEQINMDIDYTNTIGSKLTLDLDFTNDTGADKTDDEENIFALGSNLFANEVLPAIADDLLVDSDGEPTDNVNYLLDLRAIAAKRSVAQNSFAAITAMKTQGDGEAAPFLKAILAQSGITPEDIEQRLGENPSYYAQMEVLTKDIYQNPTFYANLYDKPVNIERKGAALLSLEIMQDRDIYKSLLRSEAVLATLIEVLIQKEHDRVTSALENIQLSSPRRKQE